MSVRIRPYESRDAGALFEAVVESRAELSRWMDWAHPAYALSDSRAWIEAAIAKFAAGREFDFVIERAGRFTGGCGLNDVAEGNHRANLGYWVRTSAARSGVASAAAEELARWAWANTELSRLEVVVDVDNAASLRVAEKVGAVREGVLRRRIRTHGVLRDAVMHALLRPGA